MRKYITYNKTTGLVQYTGVCDDTAFALLGDNEYGVIEGEVNPGKQKIDIVTKKIVDKTPEDVIK